MDATGNQMADRRDVGSHFALRRIPKQERSRERIDEILKVAMDLIGQKGIDAVTMKEIASLSGGPIASVYQYFPNKTAIIATLYERYISQLRSILAGALPQINEAGGIADAKGVAAALSLGAQAAQIGTAYLLCPEATTSAVHRAAIRSDAARHTALTNIFSGRPARGIVNRAMRELGPMSALAPAFPGGRPRSRKD